MDLVWIRYDLQLRQLQVTIPFEQIYLLKNFIILIKQL